MAPRSHSSPGTNGRVNSELESRSEPRTDTADSTGAPAADPGMEVAVAGPSSDSTGGHGLKPLGQIIGELRRKRIASGSWIVNDAITVEDLPGDPLICATCKGHRRVKYDVPRDDPMFGLARPCPSPECLEWAREARVAAFTESLPSEIRDWTLRSLSLWLREKAPSSWPAYRNVLKQLKDWIETDEWLYIFSTGEDESIGGAGRGKTSLAVGLLRELVSGGYGGSFCVVADLLDDIRNSYRTAEAFSEAGEPQIAALKMVDVLVLDDIGAERVTSTGWVQETLFKVISHRQTHNKRTLFTSNHNLAQLAEHLGHTRTPSRIRQRAGNGDWVIDLTAMPDLRLIRR